MAIKLVAKLSVKDGFTGPMKRIQKSMNDTEKASTRMGRRMQQNEPIFRRFSKAITKPNESVTRFKKSIGELGTGLGKFTSKLNPVALGLSAIGAAAAGAYSAVKIFNATVGEAMKMQQSQVVISAMFDDKKLSKQYMKMMDQMAIKSPLLDSQAMYGNSKSFVALSKDNKQLEKMWKLAEKLMASDPAQGVEGAVFALRELFSGDAVSIVERFELSRDVMNEIKKLPLEQQLTRLDQYFTKLGYTDKLIADMGNTALGKWTQVKERWQLIMRDMGEPALKTVSSFLDKLLSRLEGQDMKKFGEWGGRVISSMVGSLSNNAIKLYDWFTNLTKDPEFQSKSTLTGKINFIVEDVADKFRKWYDEGGRDKIIQFGSDVAQILVSAMDATDEVFTLGAKLGGSIWSGIIDGIKKSAAESPIGKVISGFYSMTPQEMIPNAFKRVEDKWTEWGWFGYGNKGNKNSHSGGLDRVPYDGYQPVLHKDEMVLTPQKAREYREGNGKVSISIGQLVLQGGGDMKAQARQFLDEVATLLEQEGGQMT